MGLKKSGLKYERNHWLHAMQTYVSVRQRQNIKFSGASK